MSRMALLIIVACSVASPAFAQHEHGESPYAGMEDSEIPSLTTQELEGLRTGAGMGLARPAELNHYPGPKHVLEFAQPLGLTDGQRSEILGIESAMRTGAITLGNAIIDAERQLKMRFEHGHIDDETLAAATGEIARLYGELRYTHMRAHLLTRDVLTEEQIAEYDRLRGYGHTDN